jgi:small GTP-binding protein
MSEDYHYQFKVIVVGFQASGKTSLILRYVRNQFHETMISTQGIDNYFKTIGIDDLRIMLHLWDTSGQAIFQPLRDSLYRGSDAAVLVFDICSKESFDKIENFKNEVTDKCGKSPYFILIGNKIDLEASRQVPSSIGLAFAQKHGMLYLETSCKHNLNVEKAFLELGKQLIKRRVESLDSNNFKTSIRLNTSEHFSRKPPRRRCCK